MLVRLKRGRDLLGVLSDRASLAEDLRAVNRLYRDGAALHYFVVNSSGLARVVDEVLFNLSLCLALIHWNKAVASKFRVSRPHNVLCLY